MTCRRRFSRKILIGRSAKDPVGVMGRSQDRTKHDARCANDLRLRVVPVPSDESPRQAIHPPQAKPYRPQSDAVRIDQQPEPPFAEPCFRDVDLGLVDVHGELGQQTLVIRLRGLSVSRARLD